MLEIEVVVALKIRISNREVSDPDWIAQYKGHERLVVWDTLQSLLEEEKEVSLVDIVDLKSFTYDAK